MAKARPHVCDTESPSRPCCWAARMAELKAYEAADDARVAKYGALRCPVCHQVYRVTDGIVEDHAPICTGPLSEESMWR
jgi:hypothetical protein